MKRQSNGHVKFEFGTSSRSKLVCVGEDGKIEHINSFDGRKGTYSQRLKLWDTPNQFTFERGITYLKEYFDEKKSSGSWRAVYISDIGYPITGKIECWLNLENRTWQTEKPLKLINPTLKPIVPECYLFKLWLPLFGAPAMNFYSRSGIDEETGELNKYSAILNIKAQYNEWKKRTSKRTQAFGKIYGTGEAIYSENDNPPCTYYFDTRANEIYYHGTKRRPELLEKAVQIYDNE
jgi:hypothetical protein